MANEEWFYFKEDQKLGPVAAVQLRQLASSGQLLPTDKVLKQGWAEARLASTFSGLFKQETAKENATNHLPNEQIPATPFVEWYRDRSLSSLRWFYQSLIWLIFGYVWIPIWYFFTATPTVNIRQRWASLSFLDKAISCLPLLLVLVLFNNSKNSQVIGPANDFANVSDSPDGIRQRTNGTQDVGVDTDPRATLATAALGGILESSKNHPLGPYGGFAEVTPDRFEYLMREAVRHVDSKMPQAEIDKLLFRTEERNIPGDLPTLLIRYGAKVCVTYNYNRSKNMYTLFLVRIDGEEFSPFGP